MQDRKTHLRIKIKSLADEAQTIRDEANKTSGMEKWELNAHRTGVVRREARHSLLAYGFLRYRSYASMEAKCYEAPSWDKVRRIVKSFGIQNDKELKEEQDARFEEWLAEAKAHIEAVNAAKAKAA